MRKWFTRLAEDDPMAAFWLVSGAVGLLIFSAVFIHYDRIAIEAELPDCPYLVFDFTIGKEICVSPAAYEAFWRDECPGARPADGVFVCGK